LSTDDRRRLREDFGATWDGSPIHLAEDGLIVVPGGLMQMTAGFSHTATVATSGEAP
jgi:hypothetical protein